VFHHVVVFNQQSRHVADSLRKGDSVLIAGDLRFGTYIDKESGQTWETRDVVADNVGASLKFADVNIDRAPKANGHAADKSAKGPVAAPASYAGTSRNRMRARQCAVDSRSTSAKSIMIRCSGEDSGLASCSASNRTAVSAIAEPPRSTVVRLGTE
jgi:single-stranded DNA-binding protein